MRAVFRVDASSSIGSGHLSRCLTLASALRAQGVSISVATRSPTTHTREWIERAGHELVAIEGDELDASLRAAEGASLVIVDLYTAGAELHDRLRDAKRVVCTLDDLASARVGADVVLNGNFYGADLTYDAPPGSLLLLGPAYALVRDEFILARDRRVARTREPRPRVLVTMGGADPSRATEWILDALDDVETMNVTVVVGGANPRVGEIQRRAARIRDHEVTVVVDSSAMGTLMAACDVVVAAAGSTCLELACVGVATLAVVVAENQKHVGAALVHGGLMDTITRDTATLDVATRLHSLLADSSGRAEMERRQRATIDGMGKDRAAGALVDAIRTKG